MAEFATAAIGALIESVRLPGTRTPGRLATWSRGTPELALNLSLVAEAFLQLLASGLGTLALVWATVVLLGGYSTMLLRMDFWFTTAIVFVETARIVGYNSAPEAKFFVDVAAVFSQKNMRVGTAINFVRLFTMGPTWLALAPIFAATACMSLSIIRLVGIATHDYGSSSINASNSNLKPALILFYALVLIQGALFLLWFVVAMNRWGFAADLGRQYLKNLSWRSRIQFIHRYVDSIADTCIQKGVCSTINTTLVSFAAELLMQSEDPDDHVSAVLALHSLVVQNTERSDRAVEQICSLEKFAYRLVRMLLSENLDPHIKANIADIVSKLACKLRLADIPGAAHCISSLLDPHFMKKAAQTGRNYDYHLIDIDERAGIKPLFVHGLVIFGKLAADPENCTKMYNTMDLVPKIIAPVSNGLHTVLENDTTAVAIVRESLRVVAKLTSGTGESSRKLCHELPKYGRTAENIVWILSNSSDQEMREKAIEILRLTLNKLTMYDFIVVLQRLLFDPQDSPLRIEAGKALSALVTSGGYEFPEKFRDIQQLLTIMSADAYSKEYRAVMAEILAQICVKSTAGHEKNRLISSLSNALSVVFGAIVTETTGITHLDERSRNFLASFLGLAVQIREKLSNIEAFANAVTGLPIFAERLKWIIEITTKYSTSGDEVYLAIMKSVTKLVTWMMEEIDPSSGLLEEIVQKLEAAVKTMVHLERYAVMTTGGADEIHGYVTLQTLVETARNELVSGRLRQQQQR